MTENNTSTEDVKTEEEGKTESTESTEVKTDYEAELKRERELREQAEQKLNDTRAKAKDRWDKSHKKDDEEYKGDDEEEDKPLTARELQVILERERQQSRKEVEATAIAQKAKALAGSDAEANLIIEIHKNRTFPSYLSLDEQLEESFAIANRKKLIAQNAELKRALSSKDSASTDSSGTYREPSKASEPNSTDNAALKAQGMTWDGRFWTKKIVNGKKTFYYDPKSKKRWTA